ncbi:MAG TPA: glycosyltransferase family 4 protein [Alphaproteobacteria bacterium]|nr:glycosyltransferase family 4 protein [Alphaproteobacteria bacterium]
MSLHLAGPPHPLPAPAPQRAAPCRVLMTLDAVGGVWRYAMNLGAELARRGANIIFACCGPAPSAAQRREAAAIGTLVLADAPLDWMEEDEHAIADVPSRLAALAEEYSVDLVHLNLPSQAAALAVDVPIVVVSHSCIVTWFHAVRGTPLPPGWQWQRDRNAAGLAAADAIIAPSRAHADLLAHCYGPVAAARVVHNAARAPLPRGGHKAAFVLAAGRWWDEGKNGATLDRAAAWCTWPVLMAGSLRGPDGNALVISHAEALGELPHGTLQRLMQQAGIVVSPSLYEPFGLAALEGAAAGAALVLADIPTYRELWDGAAVFVPPRAPAAYAAAINRLAAAPRLRATLGRCAAERARHLTPAAQADAMQAVYRDAMRRHAGAQRLAS